MIVSYKRSTRAYHLFTSALQALLELVHMDRIRDGDDAKKIPGQSLHKSRAPFRSESPRTFHGKEYCKA